MIKAGYCPPGAVELIGLAVARRCDRCENESFSIERPTSPNTVEKRPLPDREGSAALASSVAHLHKAR